MAHPNPQNLIRPTPERQREIARMGGKVKSLAKKLAQREYCISTCPLWLTCWAKHSSYIQFEEEKKKMQSEGIDTKKLKPKCWLKNMPTAAIQRAKRFCMDGEEGFRQEMFENLNRLGDKIHMSREITPGALRNYMATLERAYRTLYGEKSKIEGKIEGSVSASDFATAFKEAMKQNKEEENI